VFQTAGFGEPACNHGSDGSAADDHDVATHPCDQRTEAVPTAAAVPESGQKLALIVGIGPGPVHRSL
jgi:hypothetical protein